MRWPALRQALVTLVTAAAFVALCLVGVRVLASQDHQARQATDQAVPLYVPVAETYTDDQLNVQLRSELGEPPTMSVAGSPDGVVTRVFVKPGGIVRSGDPVIEVNRRVVRVLTTDAPLHRALKRGDEGRDVLDVTTALHEVGLLESAPAERFDRSVESAVRELQRLGGDLAADGTISIDDFAWMPTPSLRIASLNVAVGSRLEGFTAIAGGVAHAVRTSISVDRPIRYPQLAYVMSVANTQLNLPVGWIGDGETEADITATQLPSLATDLDPAATAATVRLRDAVVQLVVPASAVLTRSDGQVCVFTLGSSGSHVATTVTLSESSVAGAAIASGLTVQDQVLSNPAEFDEEC